MTLFFQMNTDKICQLVNSAKHRVAFIGPAMTQDLAASLVNKHIQLGDQGVTVILDYNQEIFRLGYGEHAAIELLKEKHVPIRKQSGLRISALLVDDRGWVMHQSPMAVEDPNNPVHNAIELLPEQIAKLVKASGVGLLVNDELLDQEKNNSHNTTNSLDIDPSIEIGREPLSANEFKSVKQSLDENPPQAFDLQRQVKVYSALVQFVSVEFEGARVEQLTIKLPDHIRKSIFSDNPEIDQRLNASYRLLNGSELEGLNKIKEQVKQLREFTRPLNKRLGSVMLCSKRNAFNAKLEAIEKQIESWKKGVITQLQGELDESIETLCEAVVDSFLNNLPIEFEYTYPTPASREDALKYLKDQLANNIPSAEKLVENMKLYCTFKAVTYEMLKDDKEFIDKVCEAFPVLRKKLMNESDAAFAKNVGFTPDLLNQ